MKQVKKSKKPRLYYNESQDNWEPWKVFNPVLKRWIGDEFKKRLK